MSNRCKCTQFELIELDVYEHTDRFVHSIEFCGGRHAYDRHVMEQRIEELEEQVDYLANECAVIFMNDRDITKPDESGCEECYPQYWKEKAIKDTDDE